MSPTPPDTPKKDCEMLTRRLAKTKHLLETEGPRAVIREIHNSLWLRLRLKAMAHKKSAELDGCSFSLQTIPDSLTKLFLLNGQYELPERQAVTKHLRRDLPVIELGGALGVVACVTNKLLENPTAHVVVEANPFAIKQLTLNKESNHCKFTIVNRAVAYGADHVTFRPTIDLAANSIDTNGSQLQGTEQAVTVQAIQLGKLVTEHGFSRYSLVCDIEGKEYELIHNESEILKQADTIILETHARLIGQEKNASMMRELIDLGFTIVDEEASVTTLRRSPGLTTAQTT
jgi:FkbM family methyltransferase